MKREDLNRCDRDAKRFYACAEEWAVLQLNSERNEASVVVDAGEAEKGLGMWDELPETWEGRWGSGKGGQE